MSEAESLIAIAPLNPWWSELLVTGARVQRGLRHRRNHVPGLFGRAFSSTRAMSFECNFLFLQIRSPKPIRLTYRLLSHGIPRSILPQKSNGHTDTLKSRCVQDLTQKRCI